ncbi:MAG: hypothetical protein JXQ75_04030 [Phycisphaerae bacterium]|nr:hypothetical protein [Phycisphaerae bacterium]
MNKEYIIRRDYEEWNEPIEPMPKGGVLQTVVVGMGSFRTQLLREGP